MNKNEEINDLFLSAVEDGNLNLVKQYLKKGADINYNDGQGPAITISAEKGHINILKFLIEKGVDPHIYSEQPLLWAATEGHLNIVKFLVEEQNADVNVSDKKRPDHDIIGFVVNSYIESYEEKNEIGVIKYLMSKGANIHKNNDAAFKNAVSEDAVNMVKFFVENGSSIEYAVKNGGDDTKEWALDWLLKERKKSNSLDKIKKMRNTTNKSEENKTKLSN